MKTEKEVLENTDPRTILQTVIEEKVPAILSYLSNRKWHVTKVILSSIGANRLEIKVVPKAKPHPINIRVEQPVGVSIKHGYGKLVFETKVISLEPSADSNGGGTIVLMVPDRIESVQRRAYFRVKVPAAMKVNAVLWHRSNTNEQNDKTASHYWQGRLMDISAGGAQVVMDLDQEPDFKKGQFIGMRFTPMPYEQPLLLNAQIRNILPTADKKSWCLG
ncbi:MAG: flagellar brake protein, partial [Planctomycetota bacterium]